MAVTYNNSGIGNVANPNRGENTQSDVTITGSAGIQNNDSLIIPNVQSKTIDKTFGKKGDYIELHIYNIAMKKIHSNYNFSEYTIPPSNNTIIQINPTQILNSLGYTTGEYIIHLNPLRNKIFDTAERPFEIIEISNSRREIRSRTFTSNEVLDPAVNGFIVNIESAAYFKEFSLNFGNDVLVPCINILLNKRPQTHQVLFKTLQNLPPAVTGNLSFKVVEEISDPIVLNINLGDPELSDNTIPLSGPNFMIDVRQNSSIPSQLRSYDDILNYDLTSSYQNLLSRLGNDHNLNIDYSYIRPVSASSIERTYHFENFVHFGSAYERLKNFKYKLELIESYNEDLSTIDSITGDTATSAVVLNDIDTYNDEITKVIEGFDGYEQFMYFESGAYSWPKRENVPPYSLYSVTSSEAKLWFGEDNSAYSLYGGQLLSASLFDRQNPYNLVKTVPSHITDNPDNSFYSSFVNMIGQHFDYIWTYIGSLGSINDADNKDSRGISKDLVFYKLQSIGIPAFDQFENSNLTEYFLGGSGISGSINYNVNHYFHYSSEHPSSSLGLGLAVSSSETLITASNQVSIAKQDITKEIWKRLYHNAPYLLKTKGSERGIKALMSCYGVPGTMLNVKEYGGSTTTTGPIKDLDIADYYKTFTYEKASNALSGDSAGSSTKSILKTPWSSSLTDDLSSSAKTVEFQVKPIHFTPSEIGANYQRMPLFVLDCDDPNNNISLEVVANTAGDISQSNDEYNFGHLRLNKGSTQIAVTPKFPIFDGDFWNIHVSNTGISGSDSTIQFGAYKSNFNRNILKVIGTYTQTEQDRQLSFGDPYSESFNRGGAEYAYFGGGNPNTPKYFTGSMRGIRMYFHESGSFEPLKDNTLKKHALDPAMYGGNSVSSSYDELVLRAPLGLNGIESTGSFHPEIGENPNRLGHPTSSADNSNWEAVVQDHYLPTPDTVGISTTSEKVRIDEGTVADNILSHKIKGETSTLDRQPQDFRDLGIFFSPTNEINEDIIYTLGSFRLDDFIGSPLPSVQTASIYEDLKSLRNVYKKKVQRRYNYWDYIKLI